MPQSLGGSEIIFDESTPHFFKVGRKFMEKYNALKIHHNQGSIQENSHTRHNSNHNQGNHRCQGSVRHDNWVLIKCQY
jgi:hypothetical protein